MHRWQAQSQARPLQWACHGLPLPFHDDDAPFSLPLPCFLLADALRCNDASPGLDSFRSSASGALRPACCLPAGASSVGAGEKRERWKGRGSVCLCWRVCTNVRTTGVVVRAPAPAAGVTHASACVLVVLCTTAGFQLGCQKYSLDCTLPGSPLSRAFQTNPN